MGSSVCMDKKNAVAAALCIALLIATLAAVGPGGRRRAKESVCRANLRIWGEITDAHAQDNDGRLWDTMPGTPCYWWVRYMDEPYKDWKTNRFWFCPTATVPIIDENGNTGYPSRSSIFNAWGIWHTTGVGPNGISGSYAINGYVLEPSNPSTKYEGGVSTSSGWHTPYVQGADRVPLYVDALRFDLWPLPTNGPAVDQYGAWTGNNMARCCINRHDGAVNMAFLDFSARKVGLKELWKLKWHRDFDTDGPWTPAGGVQPQDWPQWIREFKDY